MSLVGLLCLAACQGEPHVDFADLVVENGTIYTANQEQDKVQAMAIKDGKIIALGSSEEIGPLIGKATKKIDLADGSVLPGLIDGHLHPVRGAIKELYDCNFPYSATIEEIQARLSECVTQLVDGDWVVGGQWDSGFFERNAVESPKSVLDSVSTEKAILLKDDSLHNVWVNSKALELAGITGATNDPEGGTIVRNKNGEPNGILLETAAKLISKARPPHPLAQQKAAVLKFVDDANAFGLTGAKSASSYEFELEAMHAVATEGKLSLYMATSIRSCDGKRNTPLDYDSLEIRRDKYQAPNLDTRFVKIFLDGVPTPARTAAMLEPYQANDQYPEGFNGGELLVAPEVLAQDIIELDKRGFTVKMHAAGDRSVRIALDAIEAARKTNGDSGLRHELAHAGYIDPSDIARFKQLNAVADLSPILWYPSPIIDAIYSAVGKERGEHYFPVKDLIASNAGLLAGSDWPAVSIDANPWVGIESLVTRQHPDQAVDGYLWPEQAISLEDAINIYSYHGAKALRLEQITGSLEVGKSADFIVLQENIFSLPHSEISTIKPLQTWFNGQQVFARPETN